MDILRVFLVIIACLISIQALAISYEVIEYEDPDVQDWALNRKHGVVLARYYDEIHVYGQGTDLELLSLQIEGRTIDAQYDGDLFGVLRNDGTIEVYTLLGLELVASFENPDAHNIRFSECNTYLHAVLPSQQLIVRYDLETGLREDKAVTGLLPFDLASWDGDLMAIQGEPDGDDTILKVNLYRSWGDDQKEELGSTNRMPPAANGRTLQFFDGGNRLFVGRGVRNIVAYDVHGEDHIFLAIDSFQLYPSSFFGLSDSEASILFYFNDKYLEYNFSTSQHSVDSRNFSSNYPRQLERFFVGQGEKVIAHAPRHTLRLIDPTSGTSLPGRQMRHVLSVDFEFHPDGDRILTGDHPTLFSFPSLRYIESKGLPVLETNQFGFYDAETAFTRLGKSINLYSMDDPTTPTSTFDFAESSSEDNPDVFFHQELDLISFVNMGRQVDFCEDINLTSVERMSENKLNFNYFEVSQKIPDMDWLNSCIGTSEILARGFDKNRQTKYYLRYEVRQYDFLNRWYAKWSLILESHDLETLTVREDTVFIGRHSSIYVPHMKFYSSAIFRPDTEDFIFATQVSPRAGRLYPTQHHVFRLDPKTLEQEEISVIPPIRLADRTLYHEQSGFYFSNRDRGVDVFDSQLNKTHTLLPGISLSNIRLTPDGRHLVASAPNRFYIVDLNQPDLHVRLTLDRLLGRRLHLPPDRNWDGAIDAADLFHTLE
ncbi:MAG: hypothetical protein JJU11_04645 [Candidatus Sumerlaeia bacterium]|nr:hypothetical protein [Candidatus Sumerlaeia bacterium]